MKRTKGFTIIELLIVILVIGILAAITLVAYGTIQQRAHNTKTAQASREYLNALTEFYGENGRYPSTTKDGIAAGQCLGTNYTSNTCWGGSYTANTTMNSLMSNVLGSTLPMPYLLNSSSGIIYLYMDYYAPNTFWTIDGKPTDWLVYSIEGTGACPVGPVASYNAAAPNGWAFSSTAPASGQTTAGTCWVALTP